ncbi:MAG TPA: TonB family protein [Longimicrobiaceae bacterium]|nr:TonB family protein [Longimicrobiaceae bacterium]
MFSKIASGRRRRILSPTTIAASLGAHALLVAGALVASHGRPEPVRPLDEPHITWLEPEPPRVLPPAPPEQPRLRPAELPRVPVPRGEAVVMPDPPREIPSRLPEYSPSDVPVSPSAVDGIGRPGSPDGDPDAPSMPGAPVDAGAGGTGDLYTPELVEQRPALRNAAEMRRLLQRTYPPLLRDAGITGQAQLRLVVDGEGRVEPGSVTVVSATHAGFEEPSLKAAEKFRFTPAKIGGRGVRVVITLPITWTLERD